MQHAQILLVLVGKLTLVKVQSTYTTKDLYERS